jgi:hypothetical protein
MLFAFFRPRLFSSSFARQPARAVSAARVVGSTPGFRPRDGRGCPRVAGTRPRFRASGWPWLVHSGGPPGGLAPTKHQESPHAYPNRYGSSLHQVSLASTVLTRSVPAVIPAYPVLVERVSPPPRPFSRGHRWGSPRSHRRTSPYGFRAGGHTPVRHCRPWARQGRHSRPPRCQTPSPPGPEALPTPPMGGIPFRVRG